jgi:hypothetical protein
MDPGGGGRGPGGGETAPQGVPPGWLRRHAGGVSCTVPVYMFSHTYIPIFMLPSIYVEYFICKCGIFMSVELYLLHI